MFIPLSIVDFSVDFATSSFRVGARTSSFSELFPIFRADTDQAVLLDLPLVMSTVEIEFYDFL